MDNSTIFSRDLAPLGAGYWGRNLARNFRAPGALHTLCDVNPAPPPESLAVGRKARAEFKNKANEDSHANPDRRESP